MTRELEGVVAHELGHVLNRDILISSIAGTLAAAITALSRFAMFFGGGRRDDRDRGGGLGDLVMIFLAPLAAMLIQMAISRTREFSADATSAKYIGSPYPLIGALQKLDTWSQRIPMEATPDTQHLYIMKPLAGGAMMRPNLYAPQHGRTHQAPRTDALIRIGDSTYPPSAMIVPFDCPRHPPQLSWHPQWRRW